MEALRRLAAFRLRLISICVLRNCLVTPLASDNTTQGTPVSTTSRFMFSSAAAASSSRWFVEIKKLKLPKIVKAGDPVLHQPAREVDGVEMKSEKVQKIIDDMIRVMRNAPGVGLAAPQIGIPLRIIVLEDTEEYMSYDTGRYQSTR